MAGIPPSHDPRFGSGPSLPPELDPRQTSRGRRHLNQAHGAAAVLHPAKIIVKVLCVLLSALLIVYIGYLWNTVRGVNNVPRVKVSYLGGAVINPTTGKVVTHRHDIDGKDQNLLIVGNDDRSALTRAEVRELKVGYDGGSLDTDTMMIIHIPADGSQATLISLPRDAYVNIPGYGMNKLNAAYALGYEHANSKKLGDKIAAGADLLTQVVQNLTGLNIDHFVQVTLLGFVQISDAVGGVTVNLCNAIDGRPYVPLVLSKGKHTLKGVQALDFVRQRHGLTNGDLDRTARQRYFLAAAFRKVETAGTLFNLGKLKKLISAVQKSIYTDSGLNMIQLAHQLSSLSADNIVGELIPYDGFDNNTPVGSVEVVDPHEVQMFVKNLIGGGTDSAAYRSAKTVKPATMSVSVVNAGAVDGAATAATAVLDHAGFKATVSTSSPPEQTTTTITYAKGEAGRAKTLAEYVPNASVVQGKVSSVTLTLGTDGLTAQPKAAASGKAKPAKHKAVDAGCIN